MPRSAICERNWAAADRRVSGTALGSSGRHTPIERSLPTMSPRPWASWRGELVMLKGIVRTLAAETVSVRDFSLGPGRRQHLEMPVMPRPMLGADGYIGRDTIDGFRVTFDFKNHALEIGQGHSRFARRIRFGRTKLAFAPMARRGTCERSPARSPASRRLPSSTPAPRCRPSIRGCLPH